MVAPDFSPTVPSKEDKDETKMEVDKKGAEKDSSGESDNDSSSDSSDNSDSVKCESISLNIPQSLATKFQLENSLVQSLHSISSTQDLDKALKSLIDKVSNQLP